jgi:hypothetical protein
MRTAIKILYAAMWFLAAVFAPVPPTGEPWQDD